STRAAGPGSWTNCGRSCGPPIRPGRTARRGSTSGGGSWWPGRPDASAADAFAHLGADDAGGPLDHRMVDGLAVRTHDLLVALPSGAGAQYVTGGDAQQERLHRLSLLRPRTTP